MMKKWEYKSVTIKRLSDVGELNELGGEGWELVNIVSGQSICGFRGIFKREIEDNYENKKSLPY